VKRLGSERFELLYDIYHMQIMEGDVIRTIRDNTSTSRTTIARACRAGTRSTRHSS
jgi:hydroxypyruvate isomerase